MTLVGTRPELIKMSRVIAELDRQVDHLFVHSGQNYDYELNQVFFDDLEIRKPDHFLGVTGDTAAQVIADVIVRADEVFARERPEVVVISAEQPLLKRRLCPSQRKHFRLPEAALKL